MACTWTTLRLIKQMPWTDCVFRSVYIPLVFNTDFGVVAEKRDYSQLRRLWKIDHLTVFELHATKQSATGEIPSHACTRDVH
jgi:hypothetical protein